MRPNQFEPPALAPYPAGFMHQKPYMPANNPGYLSDAEITDIVAYMLATSGMPPGNESLPPDPEKLTRIAIVTASE